MKKKKKKKKKIRIFYLKFFLFFFFFLVVKVSIYLNRRVFVMAKLASGTHRSKNYLITLIRTHISVSRIIPLF